MKKQGSGISHPSEHKSLARDPGRDQGSGTIDPATKYCQGAPSISAFFAEMGGNTMPLFCCRIKRDQGLDRQQIEEAGSR